MVIYLGKENVEASLDKREILMRYNAVFHKLSIFGLKIPIGVIKLGERVLKALVKYTRGKYIEIPGHELEHSFRVLELALYIGHKMNANLNILVISAILHDLGRLVDGKSENHNVRSAQMAEEILKEIGLVDYIQEVKTCILEHSYSSRGKPSTLESAILQDADRLDALGALGVARVFAYGGYLGRPIYSMVNPFEGEGSLKHFYDKILLLPDRMNTQIGKNLARKRASFIDYFLREIKMEIEGDYGKY